MPTPATLRPALAGPAVALRPRRTAAALLLALLLALTAATPALSAAGRPAVAAPGPAGRTWADESIYFLMTDRFANGDRSNDLDSDPRRPARWHGGDLQGVIDHLDYIKGLGMTAIWITPPVEQMPGGYHGYWAKDLYKVDPHLGDMAKLQELVEKAHARGLKVILDVVINHLGYSHPWLTDPAKQGWFHPPCEIDWNSQSSIENCWLAGLPDLNTENPAVEKYLTDWSLWLIDQTHADGFRLDTARHVPLAFLKRWTAAIKARHPGFWIIGEIFSDDYKYVAKYQEAGLDAVLDFFSYHNIQQALGSSTPDLDRLTWARAFAAKALPRPDMRGTFIDNHDVRRFAGVAVTDLAVARLRLALAFLLTAPGVPILYYGTEVALGGGDDPDNRQDMPWGSPPRPDLREYVSRLAHLRQAQAALRRGGWAELQSDHKVLVYARTLPGGQAVVVALNGTGEARSAGIDPTSAGLRPGTRLTDALATPEATGARLRVPGAGELTLSLPPYAAQVWVAAPPLLPAWAWPAGAALLFLVLLVLAVRRRRPGPPLAA